MKNAILKDLRELILLLEWKGEEAEEYKARCMRLEEEESRSLQEILTIPRDTGAIGIGDIRTRLEELRREIPKEVLLFPFIPGIEESIAKRFPKELSVSSFATLLEAAKNQKVRAIFGGKIQMQILLHVPRMQRGYGLIPLGVLAPYAYDLCTYLKGCKGVYEAEIVGEVRRRVGALTTLEILVSCEDRQRVLQGMVTYPLVSFLQEEEEKKARFALKIGISCTLYFVSPSQFGTSLLYHTGSPEHVFGLMEWAKKKNYRLSPSGLRKEEKEVSLSSEEALYGFLGLQVTPPCFREDRESLVLLEDALEPLSFSQIRGDLHMHTNYSDGEDSLLEMVLSAKKRGYAYIAITDHSQSLRVARGLSIEKLTCQHRQMRKISEELEFPLLLGTECDILLDGSLDYPLSLLSSLDFVIASIHTGFHQDKDQLTKRIVRALKEKPVHLLGHPTGKLLGLRDPYPLDMEEVLQVAKDYGKVLEINVTPERLDLDCELAARAKALGIKLAINTDAHSKTQLDAMVYGVEYASRAKLTKEDVINTWELAPLLQFLSSIS